MFSTVLKFGRIRSRVLVFWQFKCRVCTLPPDVQHLLAAKLCVGEHVLEVQATYGPPLSPCEVWFGLRYRVPSGGEKVRCFVRLFVFLFSYSCFKKQSL